MLSSTFSGLKNLKEVLHMLATKYKLFLFPTLSHNYGLCNLLKRSKSILFFQGKNCRIFSRADEVSESLANVTSQTGNRLNISQRHMETQIISKLLAYFKKQPNVSLKSELPYLPQNSTSGKQNKKDNFNFISFPLPTL